MYQSSTASSAATQSRHRATPMQSSSGATMGMSSQSKYSSRRDERATTGPLTAERAMMEQIRSKLERAQLRLAHSQAKSTSRHGYNGNSAAPMSLSGMGIGSSSAYHHHYQSSSRHVHTHSRTHQSTTTHSRSQIQSQTLQDGSSYYFPPDYKSARAPAVKSVYLEDLSLTINAEQRTPPVSTHAHDERRRPTSSHQSSYYAPPDESRVSTRHHHHHERSHTSSVHVRSERHAVHELHQHHHHHHRHHDKPVLSSKPHHHHHHSHSHRRHEHLDAEQAVAAPPKTIRGVRSQVRAPQYEDDDDEHAAVDSAFVSSVFAMHGGVLPLSEIKASRDAAPPPPSSSTSSYLGHSKQPLAPNGQPSRSALKQRVEYAYVDSDDEVMEVVAAPPSSRVRFHDQLTTAEYSPAAKDMAVAVALPYEHTAYATNNDDGTQLMHESELFHMPVSMPYELAALVEEEHSDDDFDDDQLTALEPVVAVKHSRVVSGEPHNDKKPEENNEERSAPGTPVGSSAKSVAMPSSPQNVKNRSRSTSTNSDKDPPPRRRRGSSAARTPPHHSPTNSHYIRKSLSTLEPPKSAINLNALDQFDMRARRASREKQFSQASGDVDVDAMSVSEGVRRSSMAEAFAGSVVQLSSSPIDLSVSSFGNFDSFGTYDSPRASQGSLHCSELMFEDDGSVPFDDSYTPYGRSSFGMKHLMESTPEEIKLSPSSSNEYSDARAYPEEEEEEASGKPKPQSSASPEPESTETAAAADLPPADRISDESTLSCIEDDVPPQIPRVPSRSEYNEFWQENDSDKAPMEAEASPTPVAAEPLAASDHQTLSRQPEEEPATAASLPETPESPSTASAVPAPPSTQHQYHRSRHLAQSYSHASTPHSPRKPMQFSQSMMLMPPQTTTAARNRPPPVSTHIRPSPATARPSVSRPAANFSASTTGVPRAPATLDGSTYVPRHLRPKSQLTQLRKAMPPSISVLSGLASGPVTFELNIESFYEVEWQTGEFGFSFQRVYLEDERDPGARRMFLRMLLNTERGTCASFKEVHVGDVLIEIGNTRVCDLQLDNHGGGVALTKFFTDLRHKTPLRLVFQRMDPMSWDGGVEL